MPFNGSGGFEPVAAPDFPAVSGELILASQFNNTLTDVFSGLGSVLTRDGQSPATANLPMGGFKHTGAAAASANGQYLVYNQTDAKFAAAIQVANSGVGQAYLEALHGTNSVAMGFNSTGAANFWGAPQNSGFFGIRQSTPFYLCVGTAARVEVSDTGVYPVTPDTFNLGSSSTKKWGNVHAISHIGYKAGDFGSPPSAAVSATSGGTGAAVMSFIRTGTWGVGVGLDTDNSFKIGGYTDGAGYFRATIGRTFAEFPGTLKAENITSELNHATTSAKFILRNRTPSASNHVYGALLWDAYRDIADPSYIAAISVLGANPAGNTAIMQFHVGENGNSSFPAVSMTLDKSGHLAPATIAATAGIAAGTTLVAGSTITAGGLIYGNGGGLGLGRITAGSSGPSGGNNGDIHFRI